MARRVFRIGLCGVVSLLFLAGCDTVTRHKVLSTLFDGYPSLPPEEKYCTDYVYEIMAMEGKDSEPAAGDEVAKNAKKKASVHKPYGEKLCNDCHDQTQPNGLIRPNRELCGVCHKDFIQGAQVHGPVAVGECQACHLPHTSAHPSLLKASRDEICAVCHQESRLAAGMHDKVTEKTMACVDCHDPHFGNTRYFLK